MPERQPEIFDPAAPGGLPLDDATLNAATPEDRASRIVHAKWPEAASAVYIGRPSLWGNPFPLADAKDPLARAAVVEQYRAWFHERLADPEFKASLEQLRGRTLACWCPTRRDPNRACHGDVLLAWLDANPPVA
jgi:hypothetical protein